MHSLPESITVRPAYPDDAGALRRLAALDSALLPTGPLLVAEVEGELRAAFSLADGRAVADPFHPSLGLVDLLRLHASAAARSSTPALHRRDGRRRASLRFA